MAAAAEIIGEPLPEHWTYGVTADGRVFYINDLHETTSWVHPVTNKPAASGLLSDPELPSGWEWSITPEGVVYYVDHNSQRTTFIHPLTRKAAQPLKDASESVDSQRPSSLKPVPQQINKSRQRVIDKGPEAQRMSNSKVILSGWLMVQESNSIRSWKRRWCVHADYGLFLYRDATEQQNIGSILLPSYTIRPCDASDPVNKRFAFKAEHANLRTQYFIAESKEKMDEWVKVLSQSAQMLNSEPAPDSLSPSQRPASPDNDYYVLARDPNQNGELRYQRQTYNQEEPLPEYYPADRQSAVSFQDYSPYSNIASSEYSNRNSYSSNHMSPAQPSSPPPHHTQQNNSFGEAPHSRSSCSSVGSPYGQRHDYSYKSAKPPERNTGFSPGPPHNRQSVASSTGPYAQVAEVAPRYNVSYSSLDFNAMYHNGRPEDHPSPHDSYQSIGSPQSLDNASITVPKSLQSGFYSNIQPSSQNANSRHSLSNPHSPDSYQNHRNFSPSERGPNGDSYSPRGDHNHSQLSYEIYPRNDNQSRDSLNFDVSQDSFAMNNSDIAVPYSKRLYGAQTDLSKLVVDSDHGDQKSVDTESHQEYATICRIRSESMCTSPEMMRSRPASISVSQHESETEVPKRTSVQRLQEMHLRELQRHSPLSKSFSSGNVPNYHNISQTLSQNPDNEDLEVAQSYMDGANQNDDVFKRQSMSSLPQPEYQSVNRTLSPASELQNQIVYDYHGTGHDSTLPTRSSRGLSVKPQKYPSNVELSSNDKLHNNYVNVDIRHSYLDLVDQPHNEDFIPAEIARDLHSMDYQGQSLSFGRNGHHMSNDSNLNANQPAGSDYNPMEPDHYNHMRPGSEISDPYINPQTASNLQSANGAPPERPRHQNGIQGRNINTVKEDPNMPDTAVIETTHPMFAKLKASQGRLRMSISAGDLLGKTHEELVLLLIQLRRNKAYLERCRESLRQQIDHLRPYEQEYKRQLQESSTILDFHLEDKHGHFLELKRQCSEVENKLEMFKPIENLVDNMVTMGSLYGGNNYMLATQYRKHILHPDEYIPPKKMLEFSRQHQEDVIIQKIERDVRELTNDEADLEEKMDRLCVLDRLIQEQSFNVTSLREDKEALEKTLRDIQYEQNRPSDRSHLQMEHLANQEHTVDKELLKAMLQLAEACKKLEELNAESSKLEHEIALLRSKVHGELNRSRSVPSLMGDQNHTRHKMEKDLHRVKDVMDNLSKEGARLSQALNTLKLPPEASDEMAASKKQKSSTYMETDLDSKESYDMACENVPMFSPQGSSNIGHHEGQVGFVKYVRPTSPGHLQVDNIAATVSSSVLLESHKEQPLHSQLPAHFKAGGQEVGVAVPVTSTLDGDVSYEEDNMWDISEADDNTKRFYGLLPKERPRAQTVRDVKRQAGQRRERGSNEKFRGRISDENDKEAELGDHWGTQPPNTSTADYLGRTNSPPELTPHSSIPQSLDYTDYNNPPLPSQPPIIPNSMPPYSSQNHLTESNSSTSISPPPLPTSPPPLPPLPQLQQPSVTQVPTSSTVSDPAFMQRRSSLHSMPKRLLGPKPFTPYNNTVSLLNNYEDKTLPVETVLPMKNTETMNSYSNPEISEPRVSSSVQNNNLFTAKPWATGISVPKLKRSPRRNRYLTISSSEPIKLENALQRQTSINSSAGDLIPGTTLINNMPDIVKSSTIDKFDEETIDRELMKPEKVFIPERYMPESDEEDLTEEEKEKRRAKAEKIRKVLTEQSIYSWSQQIPVGHPEQIHDHIAREKIVREHLLTVTQELAKEVTRKSKEAAGQNPSTVKTGKACLVTKSKMLSSADHNAANSKTTKSSATSQEATDTSISKLDPSNKPPSPKINSKLTSSVFQLLLADLVSESSSLMDFLAKSTCCTNLNNKCADVQNISPQRSDSKFNSKKFPNLSAYQSKIKAASLRILKNPPFFETEVTHSKFKKYPLFHLTKPSAEKEGMKESVWKYLESLLKDETESTVKEETLNPVEIIPSLEALNLEPGSSVYKKLKHQTITFNSAPNLIDENCNQTNCVTVKSKESALSELHSHSPSKELRVSPSKELRVSPSIELRVSPCKEPQASLSADPFTQSHSIQKMSTLDVPLNRLFEENPQDLEDLEVFYRLAEEILKLNSTNV